jgi:ADP-ribose pyrophosphatase
MKKWKDYIWIWCWAVIINNNDEVLLLKRTKNCRNSCWYWSIPWWWVDFWEKLEDALIREVKEEVDLNVSVIKLLWITNDIIIDESQHRVWVEYLCKIESWEIKNTEPHKCEEIKWFSIYNLPKKMTLPTIEWLKYYIEKYW